MKRISIYGYITPEYKEYLKEKYSEKVNEKIILQPIIFEKDKVIQNMKKVKVTYEEIL
jgi:hypothetical protein